MITANPALKMSYSEKQARGEVFISQRNILLHQALPHRFES